MQEAIHYKFWTVCMVQDDNKVLLIDRKHDDFSGFIPPGGKVEFPESFVEAAIREVKEETGLEVWNLTFKGINEYVNPVKKDRYMIFNYHTTEFHGELLDDPPEGEVAWYDIEELEHLPMQQSFRRRLPYFFEAGTFEIHVEWDEKENCEGKVQIRRT